MFRMSTAMLAATILVAAAVPAAAQTKLRVGQPQAGTFQFAPLQVGIATGIFRQHNIEVEVISFAGGPRVQQALTAGAVDIAIGSGPELAFIAKGTPEIAVAAMADAPSSVVLAVPKNSPLKSAADLKGKAVSISSKGSLTDWLGRELSRQQGWGAAGINLAPLGSTAAQTAALRTRQIDGMIVEANAAYRLEEEGIARVLVRFGDRVTPFHTYVLFAHADLAAQEPGAVRDFLAGWFDSVAYMRSHRDETIDIVERSAEVSHAIAMRDYDDLIGMFNATGRFDPDALAALSRSFVDLGLLPIEPDMSLLITEQYLPGAM